MFCCQLCGRDTIKRPWSHNLDGEEQGVHSAIIVSTAVIYLFKQQVDQQGQRGGTSLLFRFYTIRWHSEQDFDSDLCLKSSKQQSQQAMGTQIDHYEHCQQASEL